MLDRRWWLLAEIARRQFGVVSVAQLLECGFSRQGIARAAAAGQLYRIHRGVYSVGHRANDQNAYWMAAALSCGPAAVVSHRSGAEVFGMLKARRGMVDVSVPGRSGRHRRTIRVHRPTPWRGMRSRGIEASRAPSRAGPSSTSLLRAEDGKPSGRSRRPRALGYWTSAASGDCSSAIRRAAARARSAPCSACTTTFRRSPAADSSDGCSGYAAGKGSGCRA